MNLWRLARGIGRYLLHICCRLIGVNFRFPKGWLYGCTYKGHELPLRFFVDDYWANMQAWQKQVENDRLHTA